MQQRNRKIRNSATSNSTHHGEHKKRGSQTPFEKIVFGFILLLFSIIVCAFIYEFSVLTADADDSSKTQGLKQGSIRANAMLNAVKNKIESKIEDTLHKSSSYNSSAAKGPPHLDPPVPYLPVFSDIPNSEALIQDVLDGKPTIAGITALLQKYLKEFHDDNMRLSANQAPGPEILDAFYKTAKKHLKPFDEVYRNKPIFPIREDDSMFLSLASFREHLLKDTLVYAFDNAKHPEKLFIGAVVQNCFGKVLPDGSIDASGTPCKTGAQVIGKNAKGRDMTKVSDAPIDKNGIEGFCTDTKYKHFCENGQVRVVYVHETESLGPAMARYHASKLWGGETFFVQTDSRK